MKKNKKKFNKPEPIEVYLDFTDPTKPVEQVIAESRIALNAVIDGLDEVLTELLEQIAEEAKKCEDCKSQTKKLKWYQKVWQAIKSIFGC